MVRVFTRASTGACVIAVVSIATMILTVILSAAVSNKYMKEQVAYQRNFLLVEPEIDEWTNCLSLMAFSGQPEGKSLAYRASMVSFPVTIDDAPCDELLKWIDSESQADLKSSTYARYWFGSSAILRIVSVLTSGLDATRTLIYVGWIISLIIYVCLMRRKVGVIQTTLFLLPLFLATDFGSALVAPHVALSFLGALVFGIGALTASDRNVKVISFNFGLWLAFLDPLTHPSLYVLIVVGPFALYRFGVRGSLWSESRTVLVAGISSVLGYFLSWFAKWTFASLFGGGVSVFRDALSQAAFRTSGVVDEKVPGALEGVQANVREFVGRPFASTFIAVLVVYVIVSTIIRWRRSEPLDLLRAAVYVVIGLSPLSVYLGLRSHSVEHNWMTYRPLALSIGLALACFYGRDKELFSSSNAQGGNPAR